MTGLCYRGCDTGWTGFMCDIGIINRTILCKPIKVDGITRWQYLMPVESRMWYVLFLYILGKIDKIWYLLFPPKKKDQ